MCKYNIKKKKKKSLLDLTHHTATSKKLNHTSKAESMVGMERWLPVKSIIGSSSRGARFSMQHPHGSIQLQF